MNSVVVDIETRSKVDLASVGSYRYAVDESTEILMIGVSTTEANAPVYLYIPPQFETPDMLSDPEALELLRKADLVYVHSVYFEHALYWAKGFGGVRITIDQWRCTAAMARKAGLPAKLEDLAKALGLPQQKDPRGKALIKKFSIPQADGTFVGPKSAPEDWLAFGEYCKRDVIAEKQAHRRLAAFELTGESLATFQFDLRMNLRGIPVNVTALRAAQKAIREVESRVTREFQELTGLNPTQRNRVLELLQGLGVQISDMQADTLAEVQTDDPKAREVIRLYSLLSYAAVKKVGTMLDWVCPKTGRMRGVMKYYGAGTGRWSNSGPTIQNAKKATKEMRAITKEAYAYLCRGGTAEGIDLVYGNVFEVIASSIRHFVHVPGKEMLDGDYNAIEGRIADWVARQEDALELWRKDVDQYIMATAFVEQIPESKVDARGRDFGKVVKLAAQFGLGTEGFMRTCANWGIPCDMKKADRAIHEYYRPRHPKVVDMWWTLDSSMKSVVRNFGTTQGLFSTKMVAGMKFMFLKLPSGRSLAYPLPEINRREPTAKEKVEIAKGKNYPDSRFWEVTYWGQIQGNTWGRIKLHGSKVFENCIGEGTEVLTNRGWIAVEGVLKTDLVWDGESWVSHDGVQGRGEQEVIDFAGVWMTPDHEVFEQIGKVPAVKACVTDALLRGLKAWPYITQI